MEPLRPVTPAARRRWFRFSLRMLCISVAVVGLWFGYYINWMHQRREARAWLGMQMNGGAIDYHPKPPSAFPRMLRLLGDEPVGLILMRHEPTDAYQDVYPVPDEYLALVHRVERLFPEAVVMDLTWKPSKEDE